MKKFKKTKLVSFILFISLVFACLAFPTSVAAEFHSHIFDDAELALIAEAIALEIGVPVENIQIDADSIYVSSAEEFTSLQENSLLVNDFNGNMAITSANCCSMPSEVFVFFYNTRVIGGPLVPYGYCYVLGTVKMTMCENCGKLGEIVSITVTSGPYAHNKPNGGPCTVCGG